MKQSIKWHVECYLNHSASIARDEAQLRERLATIEKEREELAFYNKQIESARNEGRDGFDRYRYMIKKT